MAQDEIEMNAHQAEQEPGQDKHMVSKESAESVASHGLATYQKISHEFSYHGNAAHLFGGHVGRPDPYIVPAQQLTRESHRHGQSEKSHPGEPAHLPWVLVSGHQVDPNHVAHHHDHHAARSEIVEASQPGP